MANSCIEVVWTEFEHAYGPENCRLFGLVEVQRTRMVLKKSGDLFSFCLLDNREVILTGADVTRQEQTAMPHCFSCGKRFALVIAKQGSKENREASVEPRNPQPRNPRPRNFGGQSQQNRTKENLLRVFLRGTVRPLYK